MARYGLDPDVRVVLVCATRGEAGEISDPQLASVDNLGEVREGELRCACRTLGIEALYLLGYRDSGMAGTPDNQHPQALTMAPADEVVGQIVAHIRREKPDVVITHDETGGYGHPDHIAVHTHTKAAFAAATDSNRFPEQIEAGLAPHQAHKLYFTAIPRRFFRAMVTKMEELGLEVPHRYRQRLDGPFGLPDDACTTDVNVQPYWEIKQQAIQCHATQLKPDSLFATLPPDVMRELQAWECFQLVYSDVDGVDDRNNGERDLLAGLLEA